MFAILSRINSLFLALLFAVASSIAFSGCNVAGDTKIDEGVVIVPKAILKSSTAKVSLNIRELKRGDRLDILDEANVKTPTQIEEWYKVRAATGGETGWLEARYIAKKSIVDKTNAIFEKTKDLPSQGQGKLKVRAKLRTDADGDVVTYLNKGLVVDIVGKARTTFKPEKADTDSDASDDTDTKTVLWYEVRLPESEVLRSGWIGAQQVDLDVPDEILHLEGDGRFFSGWVVYDQSRTKKGEVRNNYIGLMKSVTEEAPVDFTRLWFLNYSPDSNRYVSGGVEDGLRGMLPITLGTQQGGKGFTFNELDASGKLVPVSYAVIRSSADHVNIKRLTPSVSKPPKKRR
jgi:hypothetical protein